MIEAVVHNKVPNALQNDEDCLTSTVWGVLKYRPMRPVVARFLSRAAQYVNSTATLGDRVTPDRYENDLLRLKFWNRVPEFGEPDVLIECGNLVFLIEDKFCAPLSGNDQLQKYGRFLAKDYSDHDKYIIYLTADWDMPTNVPTNGVEGMLYWLSWYELHSVASELRGALDGVAGEMADDLVRYLECLGFYYFHGFSTPVIAEEEDRVFWDDVIPIISNYELQTMPEKWFWQEEI